MPFAFRLFFVAALGAGLAACASLPPRPVGADATFKDEMAKAIEELKCASVRMPPEEFPQQSQHFTCILGGWSMVHLTYEPDISDANKVGVIKLIWQEWKEGAHVVDERTEVIKVVSYIAERFLPNSRKKDLVELFFGKRTGSMMTAEYGIWYHRNNIGMAYANKIELRPRAPHYVNDFGFTERP
jgi:hypothetical protein